MSDYQLEFRPAAVRQPRKLLGKAPSHDYLRIEQAIEKLKQSPRPHGTKHLSETTYRLRLADWWVIYEIDDRQAVVTITKVARRAESTYKE